jgi:lysine 6-dehydrogenase
MQLTRNIAVLGAGLVGKAIAADLSNEFNVTAVDISDKPLEFLRSKYNMNTVVADLSDPAALREVVKDAGIVVGALPGFMGYEMIKTLAPEKKDIVDISFFPEDPFTLDELAKEHGVTVITDCGVAPGMGNIILGYHNSMMDVESYACYVGGLPFVREWPWEYKAVFSPIDVIEEYTRPARYVENGHLVVREALSDPELLHFDNIGSLEAWNSDGLRTLIRTMNIPNMIEKTLRYPGCIEYLRVLREAGFFSYDKIDINGTLIRPIDVTAKLLFPRWELGPGEEDFTVMRIIVRGTEAGKEKTYTWELFDRYDRNSGTISMARTTGYTCTAAVHLLASGRFGQKGICPPEYLGSDRKNFRFIVEHLADRGVEYRTSFQ